MRATTTCVKRAYRYRLYPTVARAVELSRTFGCVRKVHDLALAARTEAWARPERVNYDQTSAMLTAWKKTEEPAYLNAVSSVPLQRCLRHLQTAFTHFFGRRAKYPWFKSKKKSRASAEYTTSGFRFRDGKPTLARMREPLNIVWARPLPEGAVPSTVTVSQDAAGRSFVSPLCDDPTVKPLPKANAAIGIDVGLDHLLTLSTGEKVTDPRHERKDRARLTRAQRELSRKAKGSADPSKARREVARVDARITDRRRDHPRKLTTRLLRDNQAIVIEDLSVRNMVKNHSLARALSDAAWHEFRSMLECKASSYGREIVVVDRFFPSSRLCSACGTLQHRMPLQVHAWTCDSCGTTHDRDVNAAINLKAAGLAVSAYGAGIRPQRRTPGGQSATKQESPRREP